MSVVGTVNLSDGLYVPFRGVSRMRSPVGTLSVDGEVTGDGGGGSASIVMRATRLLFGFHPLLSLTRLQTFDTLATVETNRLLIQAAGNERIDEDYSEVMQPVEQGVDNNVANAGLLGIPIEPDQDTASDVITVVWTTNETSDLYHLHAFFMVYDMEALARSPGQGHVDLLVAGIR